MVNEILRRGPGAGLVEGHHDSAGEPGSGQQRSLAASSVSRNWGVLGLKKLARVRLERHRQRRLAMRPAHLEGRSDNGPVSEVNAVEITHRHHRSLGDRGRRGGIADKIKPDVILGIFQRRWGWGRDRDLGRREVERARKPTPWPGRSFFRRPGRLTGCLRLMLVIEADCGAFGPGQFIDDLRRQCRAGDPRWRLICRCRYWWWMTTTP